MLLFGSNFGSTDFADEPHSKDCGSICKQTATFYIPKILMDSVVNYFLFIHIYAFMGMLSKSLFPKTFSE